MFFDENFFCWFWFVEIGFDHWRVKSGTHVSFENNWTLNIEVSSGVVNIVLVFFFFLVSQYLFVVLKLNLMIKRLMMMMMDWILWKVGNWRWLNLHDWLVIDRTNMMMTMIEWLAVIWTNKFEQFCFLSLPSSAPDWFFAKRPDSLFCEISSTNISIFCKGLFLWCWEFHMFDLSTQLGPK